MIADPAALAAAHARSTEAARAWRNGAPYRAIVDAFAGIADDDAGGLARAAHRLLRGDGWVQELLAPLIDGLRDDPFFEPPFRVSRDAVRTGALLFEDARVSLSATIVGADAQALAPPPLSVVAAGRLGVVRYVRAGGAVLRSWHAGRAGARFSAADAPPCRPLGGLPLHDGMVVTQDGRSRAYLVSGASADVVTLTATIRAGASPFQREYALADGALLRVATLDDRAARSQMLLTLLRVAGARGAGARFDAATRDPAFFLRWSAMREWLALDAGAALPRLRAMATDDPHPEVAAAAAATLASVEARLCPA